MARVAIEAVDTVGAYALTRVALTFVNVLGAVEPSEALQAVAGELISPQLASAIGARCSDTGIIEFITVLAHVPHRSFGA